MTYRAYQINDESRSRSAFVLDRCQNDGDAVAAAMQLVDSCDVEVWELSRCVAKLRSVNGKVVVEIGEG